MKRLVTNPMIVKELRQRLRESRSWLLPTLYLLVLSGIAACAYYFTTDSGGRLRGAEVQGADIGEAIFGSVVFTQIVVLLFMAPVFSAGALTIEKEQRTLSGLLTSLLTVPQIWWGKFVSALLYLFLLLISALPLLTLSFGFGGVDPLTLFKVVGVTALTLASICAVGLWCSAMFRRSVHSTASCYVIVLVLSIVTAIAYSILKSLWENQPFLNRSEGLPAYVQAPMFLNPFYPLIALFDRDTDQSFSFATSSILLFIAMACLAAAFAMKRIKRAGEHI